MSFRGGPCRGAVESMSISYDNLRRLILEAVAFGSVLFDAEAWVR